MESIRIEHPKGKDEGRGGDRRECMQITSIACISTALLDAKKISSHIPSWAKKRCRGRPRTFDKASYKKVRSMIERSFGWIKNFRKINIRYERLAETFLGSIHLASIMILWRVLK